MILYLGGLGGGSRRGWTWTPRGGTRSSSAPARARGWHGEQPQVAPQLRWLLGPSYGSGRAEDTRCRQYRAAGSDRTRLAVRRPIQYRL